MDRIAFASERERKAVFVEVAEKARVTDYIVEKDFWVSWALGRIFRDDDLAKILCFKGGTSLSKAFRLIDRFSEDIDLILATQTVLREGETLARGSNTDQERFNKEIDARACQFIATVLKDKIALELGPLCEVIADRQDSHVLLVRFPCVFDYSYIQPTVKLEIGPLALWNPNEKYSLSSFVSDNLPELGFANPAIPTVKPQRTFWEKITILHHEHYRPPASPLPSRYSRHYYDVFKIGHSPVKDEALSNLDLLDEVIAFKKRFYPRGWARYDEARPGTLRIYPAEQNLRELERDYGHMQNMFYSPAPRWDEILTYLRELEEEINKP